jgi:hypothetical protein
LKSSHQAVIRSTAAGTILGALAIMGAGLGAIWISGMFAAFSANRGFLQLVLAVPLALLATAGTLAFWRVLTPRQMLWAILAVEALILYGIGAFGGFRAWPWLVAISAALVVPWLVGLAIGRSLAKRH